MLEDSRKDFSDGANASCHKARLAREVRVVYIAAKVARRWAVEGRAGIASHRMACAEALEREATQRWCLCLYVEVQACPR